MLSIRHVCSTLAALPALALAAAPTLAADATITVHADRAGARISPTLYGIFFEEINRAGDGGIYGEMLENRSFEDNPTLTAWQRTGSVEAALDRAQPLNATNPTALRLDLAGDPGGVVNRGFKDAGLAVRKGAAYRLTFYARAADGFTGPVTARLESRGGTVLAEAKAQRIESGWKRYSLTLKARGQDPSAQLALTAAGRGRLWLDQVSLFPTDTFHKGW